VAVSNDLAEITSRTSKTRASKARFAFAGNSVDITSYYAIHQQFVKTATNKMKRHVYILNKATYVLVASLWEAYCEDVVTESIDLLVQFAPTWKSLPRRLVRDVAKELRQGDAVLLAPWELAGDGWRKYIKDRQTQLAYQRNYDFAGPKSASVERFFSESLGLPAIRDVWREKEGPSICSALDGHLDQRNNIVHRITSGPTVNKRDVNDFYNVVRRLVKRTDQAIDQMLTSATGESRWSSFVRTGPVDIRDQGESLDDTTPST
jgi:hypothetical protein